MLSSSVCSSSQEVPTVRIEAFDQTNGGAECRAWPVRQRGRDRQSDHDRYCNFRCEACFQKAGCKEASYFSKSGILHAWKVRDGGASLFCGETPLLLGIVFETRVTFCVLETTVRAYLHDTTIRQGSGEQAPDTPNGPVLYRRRSSGAQLHMQLSDQGALWNMQLLGEGVFLLQPLILAVICARIGRTLWLGSWTRYRSES